MDMAMILKFTSFNLRTWKRCHNAHPVLNQSNVCQQCQNYFLKFKLPFLRLIWCMYFFLLFLFSLFPMLLTCRPIQEACAWVSRDILRLPYLLAEWHQIKILGKSRIWGSNITFHWVTIISYFMHIMVGITLSSVERKGSFYTTYFCGVHSKWQYACGVEYQ